MIVVNKRIFLTPTLYIQVLEFVDEHGNEVLNLGSFALLPLHVVRLILSRDELKADEFTKFQVRALDIPVLYRNGVFFFDDNQDYRINLVVVFRLHLCGQ